MDPATTIPAAGRPPLAPVPHAELDDGAVVVELPYGSDDWLVREVLKGVGDLVVLEPSEAREAVAKGVAG